MGNTIARIGLLFLVIFLLLGLPHINKLYFKKDKKINLFTWIGLISPELLKKFEKESGIKVNLQCYVSNEELISKLKISGNDFDVVFPSDYSVKKLIEMKMLKPLDKEKLPISKLDNYLMGHFFDLYNHYSIPYMWECYGLWCEDDKKPYTNSISSLFTSSGENITISSDPVESIILASHYLSQREKSVSKDLIRDTLKKQFTLTGTLVDYKLSFLFGKSDCSKGLFKTSIANNIICEGTSFLVPEDIAFISIENIVIPKGSSSEELTYQLIEFLYREEIMKENMDYCALFPAIDCKYKELNKRIDKQKCKFFTSDISIDEMIKLWIEIKA